MRRSVGNLCPASPNRPVSATLSFLLSAALILIPALPAPAAHGRAASGGRAGVPFDSGHAPKAAPAPALAAPLAPSITATKVDSFNDTGSDGKAEPGQTVTYTVTITNNGTDAANVAFSDTVDPNTTLVNGSVSTQPLAANDSYGVLGNVRIQPNAASGLLANDCDPDNAAPAACNTGLTASGPSLSAQGGNVSVNPDGSFSYNPPAGYEGPDSFQYTVSDGTHTDTAVANFVVADVVWFVDNTLAANGDGRLSSPFNTLAPLTGATDPDDPSDVIFVHEGAGAYEGGVVLEDGQRLVGQGAALDSALASFGIVVPAHSDARPAATGNPVLANSAGNVVTLADGNTVLSLNAASSAASASAVFASGASGPTVIANVGVGATGSANGVTLAGVAGPVSVTNSSVACTSTGTAVLVNGGAAGVNFAGTSVSQNGGRVVYIHDRTGGTVAFDAASTVSGTNGAADAITLDDNAASSVFTFSGPVNLNTNATGARGLFASGGSTLNMTNGGNAVNATGGPAAVLTGIAANVVFATTFSTNSNGRGLFVDSVSGTASFGNTTVNNSADDGVRLSDNSADITFTDLDIAPAAGQPALSASGNTGTLTSSSGVVTTTNATAVQIEGASAAGKTPLNLQFTSVSSSASAGSYANGVFLRFTSAAGSPGGFKVNGNGGDCTFAAPACTGGRITATTGADNTPNGTGVYLEDAASVSLTRVRIDGHPNYAVRGKSVSGFTLRHSVIDGSNGTSPLADADAGGVGEDSVRFTNLLGSALIDNSVIAGGHTNNLRVVNNAGALNRLTVSNSFVGDPDGAGGQRGLAGPLLGGAHGVHFEARDGVSAMNVTLSNNTINFGVGTVVQIVNSDNTLPVGTVDAVVRNNAMVNANPAASQVTAASILAVVGHGHVSYDLSCNTLANSAGIALNVFKLRNDPGTPAGNFAGTIFGNTIGVAGVARSGGGVGSSAINVDQQGTGAGTVLVRGNVVRRYGEAGIRLNHIDHLGGVSTFNATVTDNTTTDPDSDAFAGVFVLAGADPGGDANGTTNLKLGGGVGERNNFSAGDPNDFNDIFLNTPVGPFKLTQGASSSTDPGQVAADNNNTTPLPTVFADPAITIVNSVPALPPAVSQDCSTLVASVEPAAETFETAAALTAPAARAAYTGGSAFSADLERASLLPSLGKLRRGLAYSERAQVLGAASVETQAAPAAAPLTPLFNGGVNVQVGTLRAGDSVTITFDVTVKDPFNGPAPQVSNQGTVTADGGVSVQTDDPSEGGAADPTVTPLLLPPDVSVNDGAVAEPVAGTANMLFTIALAYPYTKPVTVNYATANGGANPAAVGSDYEAASGSVTFAPGEALRTVAVEVNADGEAGEGNETFLVSLSAPTNGVLADAQATGTIQDPSIPSPIIISELRTSGPGGSADDFVELLNTTDGDVTVTSSDGSAGWAIVKSGSDCSETPAVVGVIPNGAVIPARGNYLLKGSAYSLGAYAAGDGTLSADIEDDRNVGLFTTANVAHVSSANRYDAVGFGANTADNCELLREGNNLPAASGSTSEYSFVRKVSKGLTQDTTDNAADFVLVSTTPSTPVGAANPTLGAPGPEGSADPRGPVPCAAPSGAAKFGRDLVDPLAGVGGSPNVIRDTTAGTIEFRRTFTNNSGGIISALRFRAVGLTTAPASAGTADLRLLSSSAAGGAQGTTLETPPAQGSGGGVNSSLKVTFAQPFEHGDTVTLRFLFGVEQAGDYEVNFVLESTPGSGKDIWKLTGHTENGGHTDGGCNRAPIANAGLDITAECSSGQAAVTLDASASSDPDGDTPLAYEWKEGATVLGTSQSVSANLSLGTHTITLKVTDPSGDSSMDTVLVTVEDKTKPVINDPPDVVVYTGAGADSCGTVVSDATLGTATAADSCEGAGLPVNRTGVPSGNFFPVGQTTVTYTATDPAGNTMTAEQKVTVIDNTVPVVTAPANVVAPNDADSCSATVNPGTATATDNCSVQSVTGARSDNQPLNAAYPVGVTTITWTATDVNGNTAQATQTVTVQDVQKPSVLSAVAVMLMGPPFNHALINVGLSGSASDNCSVAGPLQVSVYSDEDDGPAPHSPDATNIGLGTLKLRRERDGDSDGRVYLVVVKATDGSGNTTASCKTVVVPKSNGAADQASVNAQAASAAAFCSANNGAAPAGFFAVGP